MPIDPDMEPDFDALAEAWVDGDSRTADLDPERRAKLVARMSAALESRWGRRQEEEAEIGLVVNVDRTLLSPENPDAQDTLDQLTAFVQERLDQEED